MQETIYSVSEAVGILELQSHVLRYWEEEMKLPIKRNELGHRYYTRWDIQVLLSIKELKKKGYSLKEIGKLAELFIRSRKKRAGFPGIYGDYQQACKGAVKGEKNRRRQI